MELGRNLKVLFKKVHKDAITPKYAFEGDACCDLYSIDTFSLDPMEIRLVGTGIAIQLPHGFEAQIRARSGQAINKGLTLVSGIGTVDAQYRGEIKVPLINLGKEVVSIKKGNRIAQMKFSPVYTGYFLEVNELEITERGDGGFGHTGM